MACPCLGNLGIHIPRVDPAYDCASHESSTMLFSLSLFVVVAADGGCSRKGRKKANEQKVCRKTGSTASLPNKLAAQLPNAYVVTAIPA